MDRQLKFAIIGSGMAGILAAIKLIEAKPAQAPPKK